MLDFSGFNPDLFEGLEIGAGISRLESFPIASRENLILSALLAQRLAMSLIGPRSEPL